MAKESNGKTLNTVIGKGSIIEGTLNIANSVRVDGVIKGNLNCAETLILSGEGVIEAEIKVKDAIIGGKVVGNIKADGRVELEANSSVKGDITVKQIVINEGAVFQGNCDMSDAGGKK